MNTEHSGKWRYPLQNMCIFSRDKFHDSHRQRVFGIANFSAADEFFTIDRILPNLILCMVTTNHSIYLNRIVNHTTYYPHSSLGLYCLHTTSMYIFRPFPPSIANLC